MLDNKMSLKSEIDRQIWKAWRLLFKICLALRKISISVYRRRKASFTNYKFIPVNWEGFVFNPVNYPIRKTKKD